MKNIKGWNRDNRKNLCDKLFPTEPSAYETTNSIFNLLISYYRVTEIKNGEHTFNKKIKTITKGAKKYFTHDNGGRPFLAYVT